MLADDLLAIKNKMGECLQLAEEVHLRSLYTTLNRTLPNYAASFKEVEQVQIWVNDIATRLDAPLPTENIPGLGADAVASKVAHCLGALADQPNQDAAQLVCPHRPLLGRHVLLLCHHGSPTHQQ